MYRFTVILPFLFAAGCGRAPESPSPSQMNLSGSATVQQVSRYVHDFGVVRPLQKVSHQFDVVNQGDFPLMLKRVDSQCSCTVASLDWKEIPKGGSAPVSIELTVGSASTLHPQGKRTTLQFENGVVIELIASFLVRPEVFVTPQKINVASTGEAGVVRSFRIDNFSETPWNDLRPVISVDWLRCEFVKADSVDGQLAQSWLGTIEIDAGDPAFSRGNALLQVFAGDLEVAKIPVSHEVQLPIRVFPQSLSFGLIRQSAREQRTISVAFRKPTGTVMSVGLSESLEGLLEVKAPLVTENRFAKVTVEFLGRHHSGAFAGDVLIKTDDGDICCPVSGSVLRD